jgi:hypothetical protein
VTTAALWISVALSASLLGCGEHRALTVPPDAASSGDPGAARAALQFDASHYAFGSSMRNSSTSHAFTLTNRGSADATLLEAGALVFPFIFAGADAVYPGKGGTCDGTLTAGDWCEIVVTFVDAGSSATATLSIAYDDPVEQKVVEVSLDGSPFIQL